jgi:hypothetical protein
MRLWTAELGFESLLPSQLDRDPPGLGRAVLRMAAVAVHTVITAP